MKNGLQLYNFREALKQDFKGALKEIAKIGFDGVEFAVNYGEIAPDELAAYLKELKLECAGTMFSADALLDKDNIAYEYARKLNSPAVTISASGDFTQIWKEIADKCTAIGNNAIANGSIFSYHNHWKEFADIDGEPAMCRILDTTDPKVVWMEPDTCWLTRGGYNPADFIRRYAGRIVQLHVKDSKLPEDPMQITELGNGVVDIKGAYAAAREAGIKWTIYEQDTTTDPFRSAELSLAYLKKLQNGEI